MFLELNFRDNFFFNFQFQLNVFSMKFVEET